MISKYNNFMSDLILERIINETFIYYSPELIKVFRRINNDISKDLLSIYKNDIKPDVTFVNLEPGKDEYLSFTTARNATNNLIKMWPHTKPENWFTNKLGDYSLEEIWKAHKSELNKDADVYSKSRNSLRIGRFINKVFPGKYNDKQIEEFVNAFKAALDGSEVFEIVEGDEIAKWYNYRNYMELKGSLGNSCMKEKSEGIFDIYTKNPEVCRMLILKDGDKITGRALIWKLDAIRKSGGDKVDVEYFLDRQYTIDDSDVVKFRNYAKEQGWAYKAHNNHHSFDTIVFNDEEFDVDMTVQLGVTSKGKYEYNRYPYVDTFRRYDPLTGILYNDSDDDSSHKGNYLLSDTGGGYTEIQSGVWSEWNDRRISEENAVWSDWADSYIDREDSINVYNGSSRYHGWYPESCDDIVYDEWNEFYIHIYDSVYSDAYGYSLLAEDAVKVIPGIDADGEAQDCDDNWYHRDDRDIINMEECEDMAWFEVLSEKFSRSWDHGYIVSKVMMKNYKDEWIPNLFSLDTYKVLESNQNSVDISGVSYLSEIDAEILGYNIDKSDVRENDEFQYHRDIEPILGRLYKRASTEWVKIKHQLSDKGQLRIKFKEYDDDYLKKLDKKRIALEHRLSEIESDDYIVTDFEITRHDKV